MSRRTDLETLARRHGVLAVYLFGSRADDGLRLLDDDRLRLDRDGSDLDVGLAFEKRPEPPTLADLQVGIEDLFDPLRVDLVPLLSVDSIFQFRIVDGHRVFASDDNAANELELVVMRRAAELLPIQRRIEREQFGVSTT